MILLRLLAILLTLLSVLFASGEAVTAVRQVGANNVCTCLGHVSPKESKNVTFGKAMFNVVRLTRAEAKLENTGVDYTQEMEYDLNANVTAMRRYGAINAREGALLDDLTIEYQGNRMEFVTDDAEAYPYEASLDFRARAPIASTPGASVAAPFSLLGPESIDGLTPNPAEPYNPLNPYNYAADFDYDANGNMTQDRHSAITSISYNVLNLPTEVLYEGLLENRPVSQMVYDASGRKHIVRNGVKKLGAFSGDVTRYVGDYIIVNDTVDRLQTPYGYLRDGEFHSYVFDYQGNVMVVVSGDKVDQTNLYYADGLPMNVSTDATANRFKYSAKELSLFRGLPVYDYTARHTLPQLSNTFRTMDPCAESFYSISPYSYCGGDPINCIDPTGQTIEAIINDIKYTYMALEGGGYGFVDADGNQYAGGNTFGDSLVEDLATIQNGSIGQAGINYLIESDKTCTIMEGSQSNCQNLENGNTLITWSGEGKSKFTGINTNEQTVSIGMDLAHELGHSISYFMEINDESTWYEYSGSNGEVLSVPRDEIFACGFENFVRSENSYPMRTYYSGYATSDSKTQALTLSPHPQSFVLNPVNTLYDLYCKITSFFK